MTRFEIEADINGDGIGRTQAELDSRADALRRARSLAEKAEGRVQVWMERLDDSGLTRRRVWQSEAVEILSY